MIEITTKVSGEKELMRALKEVGREYPKRVKKPIRKVSFQAQRYARKTLDANNTNATNTLNKSINVLIIAGGYTGVVTAEAYYAYWVEYGRGPGKYPPFYDIFAWVKKKLKVRSDEDAFLAAESIQRKIAMFGTEPQPFMRPAQKWSERRFRTEMIKALQQ